MPGMQPISSSNKSTEIAAALRSLEQRRQAKGFDAYEEYAEDLMQFPIDDIRDACRRIGSTERGSGEKAMPDVGTIIAECERLGRHRHDPMMREWLVYECANCKLTQVSERPTKCMSCGGWTNAIAKAEAPLDHAAYMADVRANPHNYVRIKDIVDEALEGLAERMAIKEVA